nr:hypothetical protein [Mycobacterium persicum]
MCPGRGRDVRLLLRGVRGCVDVDAVSLDAAGSGQPGGSDGGRVRCCRCHRHCGCGRRAGHCRPLPQRGLGQRRPGQSRHREHRRLQIRLGQHRQRQYWQRKHRQRKCRHRQYRQREQRYRTHRGTPARVRRHEFRHR